MVIVKNQEFTNMKEEKNGKIKEHSDTIAGRDAEIVDLKNAAE